MFNFCDFVFVVVDDVEKRPIRAREFGRRAPALRDPPSSDRGDWLVIVVTPVRTSPSPTAVLLPHTSSLPSTTMSRLACLSRSTMSSISSEHLSRAAVAVAQGCVLVVEGCGSLYASHLAAQLSLSVPHHCDSYRRRADIVIPSGLD